MKIDLFYNHEALYVWELQAQTNRLGTAFRPSFKVRRDKLQHILHRGSYLDGELWYGRRIVLQCS